MTSFTCSSRQARRQRVHWMQASRLTAIAGCDRSAFTCLRDSKRGLPIFSFCAQRSSSLFAGVVPLGHVRQQELEHHLLRQHRALVVGGDFHSLLREAAAGGRERALALDLDHAGAAVAVGAQARLVAEVRDLDAVLLRALDDGLVRAADHRLPVQLERDRHHRELLGRYSFHLNPPLAGKYFITVNAGLGAACPRPQIEASIMA